MNSLFKKVGIVYHGRLDTAVSLSRELEAFLERRGIKSWRVAAADYDEMKSQAVDSDLVLAVGGDGTLLRVARAVAGSHAPIVGVNLGKLGFMTELTASEAIEKLPRMLDGEGWADTRAMLHAELASQPDKYQALNDVVVGRGGTCRIISVDVKIDGTPMASYRADGIIVATATGSTSYALAAGGPIMYPRSRDMLLQPISPHLSLSRCLVLSPDAMISLTIATDRPATFSIDGQVDVPVNNGERITVRLSKNTIRFLRLHPPTHFYESLTQKLRGESLC